MATGFSRSPRERSTRSARPLNQIVVEQLGEDAHRYANRIGAPLFSFLRTVVMNLLRRAGFRSIHAGQQDLAHDISRMLALAGVIKAISTA